MFTSRNLVTLALVIGVGTLGWVGGARFAHHDDNTDPHGHAAQRPSEQKAAEGGTDRHAGHGHGEEKDPHAGHAHGKRPGPGEICAEHRIPEADDVLCNPGLMTILLPGEGVMMRLATPEAAARAGIVVAPAQKAAMAGGPAFPVQVTYNRARLAEVMALAGGTLRRVVAEPGQSVARGALLAEIASPGAAVVRGDYQTALGRLQLAEANVKREQELVTRGVSARMELEQAQAEQQAARATVEQLRAQLAAFGAGTEGGGTSLAVRAPLGGTVVARSAVAGQTLAAETPLFTVADLSSMWLELQFGADRAATARVGAPIEAELDGLPGRRFAGKIVQVGAGLDERTRLLRVVAEVANPDGLLKDGMFGQAYLADAAGPVPAAEPRADRHHDHDDDHAGKNDFEDLFAATDDHGSVVAVPAAAVQAIDGKAYVFVAHDEADLFELRRVETGPRRSGEVLIVAGLRAGEKVAASQGFALKSELLKSRLGASCADH